MNKESGQMLGKYRIIKELGKGGFALVYHAVDTVLENEVALKILKPGLAGEPDALRRFQQEARVTAKLFHPNIVSFFETGELDGRQYIAMRYVHGRSLSDILEKDPLLPLDQVVAIVQQIATALDYAHEQDVIHRDVKPSNIVVDETGHATLMDFGVVKSLSTSSIETTLNTVVGTPHYLAPEQAESKPVDGRADVYSLGVVAYHLLTGAVPFTADSQPSLFYKIVHETPPDPASLSPRAGGPVEAVLLRALGKRPEDRYPTCVAFAKALASAVSSMQGKVLQELWSQAQAQLAQGKFAEAKRLVQQVLEIQPSHTEAARLLRQIEEQAAINEQYAGLATELEQLRARAIELRERAPQIADPQGVWQRLLGEPEVTSKVSPIAPRTSFAGQRTTKLGLIFVGVGSLCALLGTAILVVIGQVLSVTSARWAYVANLIIGLGLGLLIAAALPVISLAVINKRDETRSE